MPLILSSVQLGARGTGTFLVGLQMPFGLHLWHRRRTLRSSSSVQSRNESDQTCMHVHLHAYIYTNTNTHAHTGTKKTRVGTCVHVCNLVFVSMHMHRDQSRPASTRASSQCFLVFLDVQEQQVHSNTIQATMMTTRAVWKRK